MVVADGSKGRSLKFWRRTNRVLQLVLGLVVAAGVWVIGFSTDREATPLVPDTQVQFSLDMEIVGSADHDVVYAVEQRARPYYRIFSFDPRTGDSETVLTVPENAIIYGIALNPQQDTLAVAYTPDFELGGSGLWALDLASRNLTEITPVMTDVFLTDPTWSADGSSVLTTIVDRTADTEQLGIAKVSVESGSVSVLAADAVNPVELGEQVYYLAVDENQARRSIGVVDVSGETTTIEIGDSTNDLDHLVVGKDEGSVRVAVLETGEGGLTIGSAAEAHGNHDVASSWWSIPLDAASTPTAAGLEPIIVYDACASSDAIVYATGEGLAIGTTTRTDLIKSRAIRFVAS